MFTTQQKGANWFASITFFRALGNGTSKTLTLRTMSQADDYFADNAYEIYHGVPTSIDMPFIKARNVIEKRNERMECFTSISIENLERLLMPQKGDIIFQDGNELQVDNVFDGLVLFRVFFKSGYVALRKLNLKQWEVAIKNEIKRHKKI